MNRRDSIFLAISISLIIALLILPTQVSIISRLTHPYKGPLGSVMLAYNDGVYPIEGLSNNVVVKYDGYGIPHIFGEDLLDIYRVLGYIHAKDRLFQMDVMRRIAEGRLSELFGEATIEEDKRMRLMDLYGSAIKTYNYIRDSHEFDLELNILEAYTDGVNQYIDYLNGLGVYPIEYTLLGIKPEYWSPIDSIAIGKFMAWSLSWSMEDLYLASIVDRNGLEIIYKLDLLNRSINKPILDRYEVESIISLNVSIDNQIDFNVDGIIDKLSRIVDVKNLLGSIYGSNNWVVSGDKTAYGYPIVSNDPHLSLTAPPIWYIVSIRMPDGNHLMGFSLPGTPVVLLGRNDYVAWGFTNVGPDVTDYYFFKWDGDRYLYRGEWLDIDRRVEKIRIWNGEGYDEIEYIVNYTVLGPLIEYKGVRYAMRWVGSGVTLELIAVIRYDFARNISDLIDAAQYFHVAPQNMVAADIYGNILYYPAGKYPIRLPSIVKSSSGIQILNTGFLPFNGSRVEGDWIDYIPFKDIPHAINPGEGLIVTANNKVVGRYPYYLGWSWADRYRFERIYTLLLSRGDSLTIEDMMDIQTDNYSLPASIFIPSLLDIVRDRFEEPKYRDAIDILDGWDYRMDPDSKAPTIYVQWIYHLHKDLWGDILGDISISFIPLETTEEALYQYLDGSDLIMDLFSRDRFEEIIIDSFREAIDSLVKYGEIDMWRWGDVLRYRIKHFMGGILPWLNFREYRGHGGLFTVFPAGFGPGNPPYTVSSSQSMRAIYILDGGRPTIYLALPGGNIGNPFSPYYENLLEEWVDGGYIKLNSFDNPDEFDGSLTYIFRGG